jgi:hypothetical protein
MSTAGFYNPDFLLRAGKFVYGPGFTLLADEHDTHVYPVNGWTWYNSVEEAAADTGIPVEQWNLDLPEQIE